MQAQGRLPLSRRAAGRRVDRPQRRAAARPSIVEASDDSGDEADEASELDSGSEPEEAQQQRTPGPSRQHAAVHDHDADALR